MRLERGVLVFDKFKTFNSYDCLWKAIAICKPGTFYRDVGDVITKEAKQHKLSVVRTYWQEILD